MDDLFIIFIMPFMLATFVWVLENVVPLVADVLIKSLEKKEKNNE